MAATRAAQEADVVMDMHSVAWSSLYKTAHAAEADRRPFSKETFRRIAAFARPHRRHLALFLVLSVVTSAPGGRHAGPRPAGWSTPSSAGHQQRVVLGLAALIAVIAVAEAGPRRRHRGGSRRASARA
ncbi:MAG: hypothetical protein WKF83_09360 [Nocardioidaceae bacterium]